MDPFLNIFKNAQQIATAGKSALDFVTNPIGTTAKYAANNIVSDTASVKPFAATPIGIATNTVLGLPKAAYTASKATSNFLTDTAGQMLQGAAGYGMDVQNAILPEKYRTYSQPNIGLTKENTPIESLAYRTGGVEQKIKASPFAQKYGLDKYALPIAFGGVVVPELLNWIPGGGGVKAVVGANTNVPFKLLKLISNTFDKEALVKVFSSIGVKDVSVATHLADLGVEAKTTKEALAIFKNAENFVPKSASPIAPVLDKARKIVVEGKGALTPNVSNVKTSKELYSIAEGESQIIPISKINIREDAIQAAKDVTAGQKSMSKLPVLVERQPDGTYDIIEGNHRVVEASRAGKTDFLAVTDKKLYEQMAAKEESFYTKVIAHDRSGTGGVNTYLREKPVVMEKKKSISEEIAQKPEVSPRLQVDTGMQKTVSGKLPSPPVQKSSSYVDDITKVQASQTINVDNLNISKEGKDLIEQAISDIKPKLEEKVGAVLSNKEALDLANRSSSILKNTVSRESTLKWEAALLNARQRLAQSAQTGTVDKQFIDDLMAVKTFGTDIARKLQSFSIKADPSNTTSKQAIIEAILKQTDDIEDILKQAKNVDFTNLKQATEFYRKYVAPKTSEWIDLLRYNSMLSSPNTHIVNMFSNAFNSSIVAPIEKALTGGIDFLGSKITGKGRSAFTGESGKYLEGYFSNLGDATKRFVDVMTGKRAFTNLDIKQLPVSVTGAKGKVATVLSIPTRILEGTDQFFTALAENAQRTALQYRQAKGVKVPNLEIKALEDAQYRLYRQPLFDEKQGTILDAIDTFTNKIQSLRTSDNPIVSTIAKFTVPFLQTPMNIFKQGVEYSPLGFSTIIKSKNKTEQISKAIIGSAVFGLAATMMVSDRITMGEPVDEKSRNDFRASGKIPYAVKLGNKWVSYSKLPPVIAFPFAMTAAINDSLKNKKIDQSTAELVLASVAKYGQFLADQSYMKSIGDTISAFKGGESSVEQAISNYPQQLVPFKSFGGWLARLFDDTQRKVDNKAEFIDKQIQFLMMNIPGLSNRLMPRIDSAGNIVKQPDRFTNLFSPVKISTPKVENIYNDIQSLKQGGKIKGAEAMLNGLTEQEYGVYKIIKSTKAEEKNKANIINTTPKYFEIQNLVSSGNKVEAEKILNSLTDEEYQAYTSIKESFAKLNDKSKSNLYDESVITRYMKAITTDPANALRALFTKEKLGNVQGNLVELQRFYGIKFDEKGGSQEYKKKRMEDLGLDWESQQGEYKLEHITPVSAGGNNSDDNLVPMNNLEHNVYTPIDIAMGNAVKNGTKTRAEISKIAKQLKVEKSITIQEALEMVK